MHVTGKGMGILNQELLPKGNNSYNPKLLWYAILTSHILLLIITWCLSSDETVLYYFYAINYDYWFFTLTSIPGLVILCYL